MRDHVDDDWMGMADRLVVYMHRFAHWYSPFKAVFCQFDIKSPLIYKSILPDHRLMMYPEGQ